MILRERLLAFSSATAMIATLSQPAAAAPWVRGFVVGTYEYAFHYGGRADYERTGEIEPGVDCPHGSTVHFSNANHIRDALKTLPWRTEENLNNIVNPPGEETVLDFLLTRFYVWDRAVSYRGWKRGIETYVNPFAALDPGEPEVAGRIADGFNLDGKVGAKDLVSPDGEKGIDNALYRAWGCDAPWRGNGNATLDMRANDKMQEGLYTIVIRMSGKQDPMNDDNVTLEIGYSPDRIVKDARGNLATDFSYRIVNTQQYTRIKARIKNGVVESEQISELHMPRIAWFYDQTGDADFHLGRIRLTIEADGSATGLIGGYRNWRDLYIENTFAQDGGQQGIREHEDAVALYYALKRNADGMADPKTGQNMGISTAYRITAAPAYVVDPKKPPEVTVLAAEEPRKAAFKAIGQAFARSTTTRIAQGVPPGTSEGAAPKWTKELLKLPNGEYLMKILDRPIYNVAVDDDGNIVGPLPTATNVKQPRVSDNSKTSRASGENP